ncbi:MAG: flagellar assembly protein FliH [Selenomonadaceae bacterium]|nr:flagellar assembly protein FliH [Selenomonadaceae bacterium]
MMMRVPNKIVRYTMASGEPVKIGVPVKDEKEEKPAEDSEKVEEENNADEDRINEETLKQMLDDIDQREKNLAERFIALQKDEKKIKELKQRTQAECDGMLNDAKQDAEQLRQRAREAGHNEGFEAGHHEGFEKGDKDAHDELKEIIDAANKKAQKTIQDAKEATAEYFIRAEDDIAKILMMAIEKILPQHFIDVPKEILPVVRESIKYVRDQKEIKVHVEPNSYDLVLTARGELQSLLTDGTAILEIISDDALKPGDCVIETPNGGVDARLSSQMDALTNAVKSMMNK